MFKCSLLLATAPHLICAVPMHHYLVALLWSPRWSGPAALCGLRRTGYGVFRPASGLDVWIQLLFLRPARAASREQLPQAPTSPALRLALRLVPSHLPRRRRGSCTGVRAARRGLPGSPALDVITGPYAAIDRCAGAPSCWPDPQQRCPSGTPRPACSNHHIGRGATALAPWRPGALAVQGVVAPACRVVGESAHSATSGWG